jgi:hemolysin-activating ACP:hemolysin acyltransferase
MVSSVDIIDIIRLYRTFPKYNFISDKEIAKGIIPSLDLNQYKLFRYPSTDVAYAFTNWAFLNKESEEKFLKTGILENLDWDSGDICWHIETVNTALDKIKEIYKYTAIRLAEDIGKDKYCHWIRMNKSGRGIKRINKMKIEIGLRKFN